MDIIKLDIERKEPEALSENELRLQAATLAGVAAVASSLVARFVFGAPLVPELMAQYIFAVVPITLVEVAVGMLGPFAKHLAFLGCVVLYGLALIGAGFSFLRLATNWLGGRRVIFIAGFSQLIWLFTMLVVIPALNGGAFGRYLSPGAVASSLSLLAVQVVYGVVLEFGSRRYADTARSAESPRPWLDRRRLVRGIGYAVLAVAAYDIGWSLLGRWLRRGAGRVKGGSGVFPSITGLALEMTPVSDFYEVSKNPFDPEVDDQRWRLHVGGLVEIPSTLSYDEVRRLPDAEQQATLECIDNPVGGDLIGNAMWRGVRLRDLLNQAGLKPGVVDIVLRASDGYSDSIPLARAMTDSTLLAYEMNGTRLTRAHGFPLRLIVPAIYGMKNVKWITQIEAVDHDFKGYWQRRGWDDRAEYKTMSRIDVPDGDVKGRTTIGGVAFAGDRDISRVEVSVDGGKNWEEAELKKLSRYSWVLWHKEWNPEAGRHLVTVRATDGTGVVQTAQNSRATPDGVSGYHRVTIDVR